MTIQGGHEQMHGGAQFLDVFYELDPEAILALPQEEQTRVISEALGLVPQTTLRDSTDMAVAAKIHAEKLAHDANETIGFHSNDRGDIPNRDQKLALLEVMRTVIDTFNKTRLSAFPASAFPEGGVKSEL